MITSRDDRLRANFVAFLEEVAPVAQTLGHAALLPSGTIRPSGLLGLPRVMSTEADYRRLMEAVDLPANGITLCSGSLGSRPDNDLPGMNGAPWRPGCISCTYAM